MIGFESTTRDDDGIGVSCGIGAEPSRRGAFLLKALVSDEEEDAQMPRRPGLDGAGCQAAVDTSSLDGTKRAGGIF